MRRYTKPSSNTKNHPTLARNSPTPKIISATPSETPVPIALTTYPTSAIWCPYPPCSTQTPLPSRTLTPTPTLVPRPSEPLDRTSAESILEWLNYALSEPDFSFFEKIARPRIELGHAYSEGSGSYFTKEEFLEQVRQRISVQPRIAAYDIHHGEINTLFVITQGWFPAWEFGKRSNCAGFDFSDQWTKEEGLSLFGIFTLSCGVGNFMGTPFP
ncbi:MAG TPA: hypothetical protein VLD65_06890 [Anaerolineales bacterium]|nr:hypothetical protein [Anaerolineales bacterium]